METLTPQQKNLLELKAKIKKFLSVAIRRDGGKHSIINMQCGTSGMPSTIRGTIDIEKIIPAKEGEAEKTEKETVEMFWNIEGGVMKSDNKGFDLVVNEDI